jgi:hypothetical protein
MRGWVLQYTVYTEACIVVQQLAKLLWQRERIRRRHSRICNIRARTLIPQIDRFEDGVREQHNAAVRT